MANDRLYKAAGEVERLLDGLFGFNGQDIIRPGVYDMRDPEGIRYVSRLEEANGGKLDFTDYAEPAILAITQEPGNGKLGYDLIILPTTRPDGHMAILSEMMTKGMHQVMHVREAGVFLEWPGNLEHYDESFSGPYVSMLGFLGAHAADPNVLRSTGNNGGIRLLTGEKLASRGALSRFMGLSFARQLAIAGEVPYKNLFHAMEQDTGWRIYHERAGRPVVKFDSDASAGAAAKFEAITDVIQEIGFMPGLELPDCGDTRKEHPRVPHDHN